MAENVVHISKYLQITGPERDEVTGGWETFPKEKL